METSPGEEPELPGEGEQEALAENPLALWRELQSYLSVDSSVINTGNERDSQTTVKVCVSNTAPVGEGRPDVCFKGIHLSIQSRGGRQSVDLGHMQPGQAIEREFVFSTKELVSVAFEVNGNLEADRFFRLERKAGPPKDVVAPLLQEFKERFRRIGINEPLVEALAAVRTVGPDMTLVAAAQVREDLKRSQGLIAEKEADLQALFRDFHLDKQTRPWGALPRSLKAASRCRDKDRSGGFGDRRHQPGGGAGGGSQS